MKPILLNWPTPITTPRLFLRPPQIGEGAMVNTAIIESLEALSEFMPWAKTPPTIDDTEEFVRQAAANWIAKTNQEPYLPLFVFDRATQQFIGSTGFHHFNWEIPALETGYWIRSSCLGLGYMTEAINALTQYAFKQLLVKRICITCDISNVRSKKIPERLNYSLEGILKSNRRNLLTNEISDTLVYAKYDLSDLPDLKVTW